MQTVFINKHILLRVSFEITYITFSERPKSKRTKKNYDLKLFRQRPLFLAAIYNFSPPFFIFIIILIIRKDVSGEERLKSRAKPRAICSTEKVAVIGPQGVRGHLLLGGGRPAKGYRLLRVPRDHCLRRVPGSLVPLPSPSFQCGPLLSERAAGKFGRKSLVWHYFGWNDWRTVYSLAVYLSFL